MRRKWLILILALLLPVGALAAVGSGIDLPAWLSERMNDIRAAVAPEQRLARSGDTGRDAADTRAVGSNNANASARQETGASGAADSSAASERRTAALSRPGQPPAGLPRASDPRGAPAGGPSIDVARLDPQGASVIAGLATPGSEVTVLADGQPIAVVTADANGEWILITPYKFANADPSLEVRLGAMQIPEAIAAKLAAAGATPTGAVATGHTGKVQRTAAAVTRSMMRELERLADNATTEAAAAGARQGATSAAAGGEPVATAAGGDGKPATAATRVASRALSTSGDEERAGQVTGGLPVPVQFVYREATFTPEGEKAAELLLRFFKLKDFRKVSLSGHADERGSENANMELAKARLDRIARYLREGGFEGELELVPKGEAEKYTGVDRSKYPIEELWQLDRRVEVMSFE